MDDHIVQLTLSIVCFIRHNRHCQTNDKTSSEQVLVLDLEAGLGVPHRSQ